MAHLPAQCAVGMSLKHSRGANVLERREMLAGSTGLEPAASGVTGRRSNQLNYDPSIRTIDIKISECRSRIAVEPESAINLPSEISDLRLRHR